MKTNPSTLKKKKQFKKTHYEKKKKRNSTTILSSKIVATNKKSNTFFPENHRSRIIAMMIRGSRKVVEGGISKNSTTNQANLPLQAKSSASWFKSEGHSWDRASIPSSSRRNPCPTFAIERSLRSSRNEIACSNSAIRRFTGLVVFDSILSMLTMRRSLKTRSLCSRFPPRGEGEASWFDGIKDEQEEVGR